MAKLKRFVVNSTKSKQTCQQSSFFILDDAKMLGLRCPHEKPQRKFS